MSVIPAPTLGIIVAMASNRVIGAGNALPWHLPADLRHFKRLTLGHCLLMGRKTFESIGRPLPGRTTVVLTHREGYAAPGAVVVHSLPAALTAAREAGVGEAFVAGGAELYRQTLGLAERLYLTVIHREFSGDATFPEIDAAAWRLVSEERHAADAADPSAPSGGGVLPHSFLLYERRVGGTGGMGGVGGMGSGGSGGVGVMGGSGSGGNG